jgi:hypothetical protein
LRLPDAFCGHPHQPANNQDDGHLQEKRSRERVHAHKRMHTRRQVKDEASHSKPAVA